MKRILFLFVAAAFAVVAGACNGGAADNVGACEAYVTQINTLECYSGATQLDPESTCSGYGSTTCDISDYFDCLTANTQCMDVGGVSVPDTSGTVDCTELARCD